MVNRLEKQSPTLTDLLNQQANGTAPTEPSMQDIVADSKKVVIQAGWNPQDTIAAAKPRDSELEKVETPSIQVSQTTEKSYASSAYEQVSNWAWWVWNTVTGTSAELEAAGKDAEAVEKSNPFHAGKAPEHLSAEERVELRKFITDMNRLIDKLRDTMDDASFDEIMKLIWQEALATKREGKDLAKIQLTKRYDQLNQQQKDRLAESNELLERTKRSQWWGKCEQYATNLGLVTAAATMSGGWGVVALFYVAGATYNQYQNNLLERQVAKGYAWTGSTVFGWDPHKTEKSSFETLKLGVGVFSSLLTMFTLGRNISSAASVAQGAATGVRVMTEYDTNISHGKLERTNWELEQSHQGITGGIREWGKMEQRIMTLLKMCNRAAKNAHETTVSMIR